MVLFNGSFAGDILILISETKSNPVNQRKVFRSKQDMDRLIHTAGKMKYFTPECWVLWHCLVLFILRPWCDLFSFDGGYQISHWYLYQQKGFHTSLDIVTGTWNTGDIHAASPHHPPVMVTSSIVTAKTWGNLLC